MKSFIIPVYMVNIVNYMCVDVDTAQKVKNQFIVHNNLKPFHMKKNTLR